MLSPAAANYRRALTQVERIQAQLSDLVQRCEAHERALNQTLSPLRTQHAHQQRNLVMALLPWLSDETDRLSRTQRLTARTLVCNWSSELAAHGDTQMATVHDQHSPHTLADIARDQAERLRQVYAQLLQAAPPGQGMEDPEAVIDAARVQYQAQRADKRARREQAKAARQAKRSPSFAQQQMAHTEQEAQTSLRQLYRQLAAALHPDREPDEAQRVRKHELMSQVNQANAQKDLLTMLRLQREAELVTPEHWTQLPEERLQALTMLLKQQAAALERERQTTQQHWLHTLGVLSPPGLAEPALQAHLLMQQTELIQKLAQQTQALQALKTLTGLKRWLNMHAQTGI